MRPEEGQVLTLRAEGEIGEYRWEFRGDITADGASEWIDFFHPSGGSGGGSRGGALPFQDLGWHVCGYVGSYGVKSGWIGLSLFRKLARPTTVRGTVSAAAARVVAIFEGEQEVEALLFESGHADVRFFLAMHVKGQPLVELVVFDADGRVLERVPPPPTMH